MTDVRARCREVGEQLNAVLAVLEPSERAPLGTLAGIPVAIKDNIDVRGVVTTNASAVGVPPPAERDATVVRRLREAGADLLCKANLLEYAAGSVSPAYGMTYNPLDRGRTAGGSSSGSAALVAAGVCDHALGTDTAGSVRVPAAYCGVVGLIPSRGLVPTDGVTPLSPTCDVVGTLTRTVEQAAVLLDAIADRPVSLVPLRTAPRIGVLRDQLAHPMLDPAIRDLVEAAVAALAEATEAIVVDVAVPELELADRARDAIVMREAWEVHRRLYETERAAYGEGTAALLEQAAKVDERAYRLGLAQRDELAAALARAFVEVDVLAGPTVPYVAPAEDPPMGTPQGDVEGAYTTACNLAGLPAVSLPCGAARGPLPAGLHLTAAAGDDERLLALAHAYERVRTAYG